MADQPCTVEANGTTVTCACSGCGIAYNHETKKYHVLCCGTIFVLETKLEDDPDRPPKRGHFEVALAGATRLEAAELLRLSGGAKIRIDAPLDALQKRVTMKASLTLPALTKKLGLQAHPTKK